MKEVKLPEGYISIQVIVDRLNSILNADRRAMSSLFLNPRCRVRCNQALADHQNCIVDSEQVDHVRFTGPYGAYSLGPFGLIAGVIGICNGDVLETIRIELNRSGELIERFYISQGGAEDGRETEPQPEDSDSRNSRD